MKHRLIPVAVAAWACACGPALADRGCGERVTVRYGETLRDVAQRCGINIETLKRANPGSHIDPPRHGTSVKVPAPPLPSPRVGGGNRGIVPPP